MIAEQLSHDTVLTTWNVCERTCRAMLEESLTKIGLKDHMPEPRSAMSCLRIALGKHFEPPKDHKLHFEKLPKAYSIVQIHKDDVVKPGQQYGTVVAVASLSGENDETLTLDPLDSDRADKIRQSMSEMLAWIPALNVGAALIELVKFGGGSAIREDGRLYWLKGSKYDVWRDVARCFELASASRTESGHRAKPTSVYTFRVQTDAEMVRAIGDALTRDVEGILQQIDEEISTGDLQERAIENRLSKAKSLLERTQKFEQSFKQPLAALNEQIERMIGQISVSTMQHTAAALQAVMPS